VADASALGSDITVEVGSSSQASVPEALPAASESVQDTNTVKSDAVPEASASILPEPVQRVLNADSESMETEGGASVENADAVGFRLPSWQKPAQSVPGPVP